MTAEWIGDTDEKESHAGLVACETREEAERRFGPLPSNVEVDFYPDADVVPDSIDRVQFLVLPYGGHLKALDRVGEMSALQVVLTQNAGFNDVLDLIPDGVQLVNAVGVHDTSTAEMALTLALAVGRNLDRYVRAQDEGRWDRYWGDSLADRRVLILGYGGGSARRSRPGWCRSSRPVSPGWPGPPATGSMASPNWMRCCPRPMWSSWPPR